MASVAVTNTFSSGATIIASQHNTNFSDIVTYINNRNSGSSKWDGLSTSGALAVDGNSTLTGTVAIGGAATLSSNLTVTGTAPVIIFNSAVANPVTHYYTIGGVAKGVTGISGGVDQLVGGSVSGDLCFRTQGGSIIFNTNSGGASTASITGAGVATFVGQLVGKGTATNDSAAAGYIGEVISASVTSYTNMATSGQYGNITSITLTAGDWDIIGQAAFSANGATISTQIFTAISVNTGNTTTDHVDGTNVTFQQPTGSGNVAYRLSLSAASTVVYLKAKTTYTVATPQAVGLIYGRRAR